MIILKMCVNTPGSERCKARSSCTMRQYVGAPAAVGRVVLAASAKDKLENLRFTLEQHRV